MERSAAEWAPAEQLHRRRQSWCSVPTVIDVESVRVRAFEMAVRAMSPWYEFRIGRVEADRSRHHQCDPASINMRTR